MITEDDFIGMVGELALPTGGLDLSGGLDRTAVVGWTSLHMLRLATTVERRTGKRTAIGKLMSDKSLGGIYDTLSAA